MDSYGVVLTTLVVSVIATLTNHHEYVHFFIM